MSLLNPLTGLRNLGKVPRFLSDLVADIRFLFSADLSLESNRPPREWFRDNAAYAAAIKQLQREHLFRVVHQAVRKQFIRQTLWSRIGICYGLLGPFVIFFWIGVVFLHLMAIGCRPELLDLPWGQIGLAAAGLILIANLLMKP